MKADDLTLFMQEMADVVPLKQQTQAQTRAKPLSSESKLARKAAAEAHEYLQRLTLDLALVPKVKPDDMLSYKQQGIQEAVFKNLRLGKYKIAAELDIHAMSVRQARDYLLGFIQAQVALGHRCVLVIHGKGQNRKPFPGLIKSCVNFWLSQMDEVQAFHSAQREHGGYGALYVMLPKSDAKRLESRETNHKGAGFR
ncbi:DNA endonuclease SmrA [Shewanella algae]